MTRFCMLALVLSLVELGCIPKAPRRANSAEARAGVPYPGAEQASVEALLRPSFTPTEKPALPAGTIWNAGYWHWDGVRYVRVSATVEPATPAYLWRYDAP